MPVKIVNATPTNPKSGLISKTDLIGMKENFKSQVSIVPTNGRTTVIKKFSVSVMKQEIKELIQLYESENNMDVITINFAIHINPFVACNNENYADSLTAVVEAAKFVDPDNPEAGIIAHCSIDDMVVIPGYHSFVEGGVLEGTPPCCPSSNP